MSEKFINKTYEIEGGGFVRVVDVMGSDNSIVQAARVSYGEGTKTPSTDRNLIRYLMRHKHTSPFEMCEIKFHIRLPIYVMRQWIRHRTANVNEYSARYSKMKNEFYYPPQSILGFQCNDNKQCSEGAFSDEQYNEITEKMRSCANHAWAVYQDLIDNYGVARESARIILPVNIFTEAYWKIDLHNLMHFLKLRCAENAQKEIRQYALVMLSILSDWVPITHEAFCDYIVKGSYYSHEESEIIRSSIDHDKLEQNIRESSKLSKREILGFKQSVKRDLS